MSATVCDHGYWLHDCALCLKRPDECDYGSCTAKAATVFVGEHESRRACADHTELVARTVVPSLSTRP